MPKTKWLVTFQPLEVEIDEEEIKGDSYKDKDMPYFAVMEAVNIYQSSSDERGGNFPGVKAKKL